MFSRYSVGLAIRRPLVQILALGPLLCTFVSRGLLPTHMKDWIPCVVAVVSDFSRWFCLCVRFDSQTRKGVSVSDKNQK